MNAKDYPNDLSTEQVRDALEASSDALRHARTEIQNRMLRRVTRPTLGDSNYVKLALVVDSILSIENDIEKQIEELDGLES